MVGAACFAAASLPGLSSLVSPPVVSAIYFVGSLFFTAAAAGQARQHWPRAVEGLAAIILLCGTLLFNVETFDAFASGLSGEISDLVVWTPDVIGSGCFLVASGLALVGADRESHNRIRRELHSSDWWIAMINLLGSLAFGLSAVAAFSIPNTDRLLDASLVNAMTLLGALLFFLAAYLLVPRDSH